MKIISFLFFLSSLYYLYFFVALGKTGSFFGFADLFLMGLLLWAVSSEVKENYWFVSKMYGYGWTPKTWQGWTSLILIVVMIIFAAMIINPTVHSGSDFLINFIPNLGLYLGVLLAICIKTGEKAHWRWGEKKIEEK